MDKDNYKQIRLNLNLNEKEDLFIYENYIKDRNRPSRNLIKSFYNSLKSNNFDGEILNNKIDDILNILKTSVIEKKEIEYNDNTINFDFENMGIENIGDFIK